MENLLPLVLTAASTVALAEAFAILGLYTNLGGLHFKRSPRYRALITEDGPEINSIAPALSGRDACTNEPVATTQFLGQRLLVVFLEPGCDACVSIVSVLRSWQRARRSDPQLFIVVQASVEEAHSFAEELPGLAVIPDPNRLLSRDYGIERTPLGLLIDATGHVRMKGVFNTPEQLAGLIASQGRPSAGLSWEPMAGDVPPSG